MASSGYAHAHAGSIWTTQEGNKPNRSVVKLTGNSLGSFGDLQPMIRKTGGPIDAGGVRPQRARQASSINTERGRAVCEIDVIMQILPGSSGAMAAYKCITRNLQYDKRVGVRTLTRTSRNAHGLQCLARQYLACQYLAMTGPPKR
jgi:hypothetical protein